MARGHGFECGRQAILHADAREIDQHGLVLGLCDLRVFGTAAIDEDRQASLEVAQHHDARLRGVIRIDRGYHAEIRPRIRLVARAAAIVTQPY